MLWGKVVISQGVCAWMIRTLGGRFWDGLAT